MRQGVKNGKRHLLFLPSKRQIFVYRSVGAQNSAYILPQSGNVVNLRKKSCLLIRNQFLLAFSSGRRGTVLTVDEVFYSDCPVEHHNKSFSSENLTFSLVCKRNYNNSTPHPSPEGATFSHWRRLTVSFLLTTDKCASKP